MYILSLLSLKAGSCQTGRSDIVVCNYGTSNTQIYDVNEETASLNYIFLPDIYTSQYQPDVQYQCKVLIQRYFIQTNWIYIGVDLDLGNYF